MCERGPSSKVLGWAVLASALLSACHHAPIRRTAEPNTELPDVTAEDLFVLAMTHVQQSDLLRAEQYLSAARERGYDEATAVFWLVRVCVSAGRYQSALQHGVNHLRDHPSHFSLRLVVASIHEALGDIDRARSDLESIVGAAPQWALPHYRLGMLYRTQASKIDRARCHLERYLELDPDGVHAEEVREVLREETAFRSGPRRLAPPAPIDLQAERLQ